MTKLQIIFSIISLHLIVGCGGGGSSTIDTTSINEENNSTTQINTNPITIIYGNNAQIYFDWNKTDNTQQSIYISTNESKDDTATRLFTKNNSDIYKISCLAQTQDNDMITYLCDENITMNIKKAQTNYILLEAQKVGSIKIVQTEDRITL